MSDIVLHHYAGSPFSEKIRLLLGYKNASYKAVDIPVIMPKPDFIPLTGGYRKTPAMQIGADIYCDSAIMCRVIDAQYPKHSIYPPKFEAVLEASAHWIDTFFFKVCVAKLFQPKVLADHPLFSNPKFAAAFMADRAELNRGSVAERMNTAQAEAYWLMHLQQLEQQLENRAYLVGEAPSIIDFSTYHCLWFSYTNQVLRDDFSSFENVLAWYKRMTVFGHGEMTKISGIDALTIAKNSEPLRVSNPLAVSTGDISLGDTVNIAAIDYGKQPTSGTLINASLQELAVQRSGSQLGNTVVHFPRLGFDMSVVE